MEMGRSYEEIVGEMYASSRSNSLPSIDELEELIRESVNYAITSGFMLISDDWGVTQSEDGVWMWDPTSTSAPACCPLGAVLLHRQPQVSVDAADPYFEGVLAALGASEPARDNEWWISHFNRGVMRDEDPCEASADVDAYSLGERIADTYMPLSVFSPGLAREEAVSGIRLRTVEEAIESEADIALTG